MIVDNSNGENSDVVSGDYDYSNSDAITGAQVDEDGNIIVTVDPSETNPPEDNMDKEKNADYDKILEELGLSKEGGMTR